MSSDDAWATIRAAWEAGYDYLYITADELPLTFARLLRNMAAAPPLWWEDLSPSERPILVGYARADGLEKGAVVKAMRAIGFRIVFVGVDAGAPLSLRAMNKALRHRDPVMAAQRLHEANFRALENARRHDIYIKAGFVLGHFGMTESLLEENLKNYLHFLEQGRDVIVSADVELLSPEPGSRDFKYLANPSVASTYAEEIGLEISPIDVREEIAENYRGREIFDREEAINDYIRAVMPSLSKGRLATSRDAMRRECQSLGIVIGDEL